MPTNSLCQGFKKSSRAADPVGQGGAIKIDAFPGEDLALAVEGKVIAILGDQHMGQQPRSWPAALLWLAEPGVME